MKHSRASLRSKKPYAGTHILAFSVSCSTVKYRFGALYTVLKEEYAFNSFHKGRFQIFLLDHSGQRNHTCG